MGFVGSWSSMSLCMLVCVVSLMHGASAQSSNCSTDTLTPLLPCLPYIEVGNTTNPAADCCSPLKSILSSADPTCICQIAPLAQNNGIHINETRALEVAKLCRQTVPASVVSCLSEAGQGAAPQGAPSTPSSPAPPLQRGGESPSLGSALLPPSLLLLGSGFVALTLHLGILP